MVQNPSWEANWFAASQEIPRISRNLKVHYRTHKRPPPVSILGQPNPVHIPTSHLLKIHPNIIHPSTPRSLQWYPFLRFPQQDPIHPPLLTHTRHTPICVYYDTLILLSQERGVSLPFGTEYVLQMWRLSVNMYQPICAGEKLCSRNLEFDQCLKFLIIKKHPDTECYMEFLIYADLVNTVMHLICTL